MKGFKTLKDSYIILEKGGIDLTEYLLTKSKTGHLEEKTVKEIAWLMLKTLNYLHTHYYCHKDIKPENILITEGEDSNLYIKLIDFGNTININEMSSSEILLTGTKAYIAPELYKDPSKLTTKVDIWSLGITLFKIVDGNEPFVDINPLKLELKITNSEPQFTSEPWKNFTSEGIEFIKCLLSKKCSLRPSAEEALKHIWFKEYSSPKPIRNEGIIQKLINFQSLDAYQRNLHCILSKLTKMNEMESIIDDFNSLDSDHDGEIRLEELKRIITNDDNEIVKCLGNYDKIKFSQFAASLLPQEVLSKPFKIKILYEILSTLPNSLYLTNKKFSRSKTQKSTHSTYSGSNEDDVETLEKFTVKFK